MSSKNLKIWGELAAEHTSAISEDVLDELTLLPASARILEVGCGYGRLLARLKELGFHSLLGVDGVYEMAKRAQGEGFEVAVGLGEALPFPDGTFDCVVCVGTLNSLPQKSARSAAVSEMVRVLQRGGYILIADFLITHSTHRTWRYCRQFLQTGRWGNFVSRDGIECHHFHSNEIQQLVRKCRVDLISTKPKLFSTIHKNLSRGVVVLGRKGDERSFRRN